MPRKNIGINPCRILWLFQEHLAWQQRKVKPPQLHQPCSNFPALLRWVTNIFFAYFPEKAHSLPLLYHRTPHIPRCTISFSIKCHPAKKQLSFPAAASLQEEFHGDESNPGQDLQQQMGAQCQGKARFAGIDQVEWVSKQPQHQATSSRVWVGYSGAASPASAWRCWC